MESKYLGNFIYPHPKRPSLTHSLAHAQSMSSRSLPQPPSLLLLERVPPCLGSAASYLQHMTNTLAAETHCTELQ